VLGSLIVTISGDASKTFQPSLTQLRAFAETARLGSICRASEELRRSQSAVTHAVQSLEAGLAVALLARTRNGSYPTDTGLILQRHADACFRRIEEALRDVLRQDQAPGRAAYLARRVTRPQILALAALGEHGSFAQAARNERIALASLYRSARGLEKEIGVRLFKSGPQGIVVNDRGERLARHFILAMRELESAEEEIRSLDGGLAGRLLVGSLMLAGNHFVSLELDSFVGHFPGAAVSLLNGTYDVLLNKLRTGSIDFMVGLLKSPPPTDDVEEETLGYDPYVIAVSRSHPLAGRSRITLADLRSSEWLPAHASTDRRGVFERLFAGGETPRFSIETHSLPASFVLLASGHRMSILTRSELALDARLGSQLTALAYELDEQPAALGVTVRRQWEPTRLQRTFLEHLRIRARDGLAQP
jgi:DNA-binding transcriptional LysR family regulator